jgi:hypothetical protein
MTRARVRLLKFAVLTSGLLMLAGCQSWPAVINDTAESTDIVLDSVDEALITTDKIPHKSEDYLTQHCPHIKLVDELGEFYDFSDFRSPTEQNLVTRVKVGKVASHCEYTDKSVTVDLSLIFEGQLGPAAQRSGNETFFSYPYFIAITSPNKVIMAREIFAVPMTYGPGQATQLHHENLRQIIPISKPEHGPTYTILVGFQLNKKQLAYNRVIMKDHKRIEQEKERAEAAALNGAQPLPPQQTVIIDREDAAPAPAVAPIAPMGDVHPVPLAPPPGH